MPAFLLEGLKFLLLSAIKPMFLLLLGKMINPKFLLRTFMDLAEMLVKHTETDFDDKRLADLKELLKDDLQKLP